VAGDLVSDRDLHPGFAAAWPDLRRLLAEQDPVLVVDAANVVGSRPDGWWRDRAGAADRLLAALSSLAAAGLPEDVVDDGPLPVVRRWPRVVVVLEGLARSASDAAGLEVVRAAASGDDAIVAAAERFAGAPVTVVTADRALGDRVLAVGATVTGPARLLALLEA
jgi:8-oxo-dGTP diphosphatase